KKAQHLLMVRGSSRNHEVRTSGEAKAFSPCDCFISFVEIPDQEDPTHVVGFFCRPFEIHLSRIIRFGPLPCGMIVHLHDKLVARLKWGARIVRESRRYRARRPRRDQDDVIGARSPKTWVLTAVIREFFTHP